MNTKQDEKSTCLYKNQVYVMTRTVSPQDASKFTSCVNTKSAVRPMCGDDKNCQSAQFMWPVKPKFSDVGLTEPAIYIQERCNLTQ